MDEDTLDKLEIGISKTLDQTLSQFFNEDGNEWTFQESDCFTGSFNDDGHGIILHFVNHKTDEEKTIKMPLRG